MFKQYIAITETALDEILLHRLIDDSGLPQAISARGVFLRDLSEDVSAIVTASEPTEPYLALIKTAELKLLLAACDGAFGDVYSRIARVVKAFKSPPIHLPRHWSEYHYKNLVAFFALPNKSAAGYRWVVDTSGEAKCVRFDIVTSATRQVDLSSHRPQAWPTGLANLASFLGAVRGRPGSNTLKDERLVQEVDLTTIGSGPVAHNRSFEEWIQLLTPEQKKVLDAPSNRTLRIVGPAGSGKTLALCMKASSIAREEETSGQAKKLLVATHSWAMAERVAGILETLAAGEMPRQVTVLPLLYLLQVHAGQTGGQSIEMIGDDSKEGRVAAIALIQEVLSEEGERLRSRSGLSPWLHEALSAKEQSRAITDLALNLYDEFSGVLAAEGVAVDDGDSIKRYLSSTREDWMPPFVTVNDRSVVLQVYRRFLTKLSDRASITTDQFVSDSIRVLETFTWRMRRETEGYDYIFVDELQLFDAQERLALELLGRGRGGVPFFTAEDPSQGMFAPLHRRQAAGGVDASVYLEAVHRFDEAIFNLIRFIYQKFPLNTIPLRIDPKKNGTSPQPVAHLCGDDNHAVAEAVKIGMDTLRQMDGEQRLCLVTLGDVDSQLVEALTSHGVQTVQLKGFDDVERLSYTKRATIVAPWQFIGGTQFSNVIVVVAGTSAVNTAFGRLRELTAVYLACSRAAQQLDVVCGSHIPSVLSEAIGARLIEDRRVN
jgi:hypothetical protein